MTEQQRREQIMRARHQQMAGAAAPPAMTDQEAMRIAQEQGNLTQEQIIMAAMLGKMVNSNLTDIKKADVGGSLKITGVDMSKVMPSGIAKAMGKTLAQPQPQPPVMPPQNAPIVPPILEAPVEPPPGFVSPNLVVPMPPVNPPRTETPQLELDFNRQTRYEDIEAALEKVRTEIKIVNEKLDKVIEILDKKKLKRAILNGPQTG